MWDESVIELYLNSFTEWLNKHSIPVNRVVAAEFGCMRRNKGVKRYLEDILTLLEDRTYHWAFYSFREDGWDGYDYELGTQNLRWEYWQAIERG